MLRKKWNAHTQTGDIWRERAPEEKKVFVRQAFLQQIANKIASINAYNGHRNVSRLFHVPILDCDTTQNSLICQFVSICVCVFFDSTSFIRC